MSGHIFIDASREGALLRRASLARPDGSSEELWFRSGGQELANDTGDPFLIASLLSWMKLGSSVHVHGQVTRRLLAGLEEWQSAWALWKPHIYQRVEVTCDEVLEDRHMSSRAIAAFSGGVDAAYTVRRQLTGEAGWGSVDLRAALLVHGFEIHLSDTGAFEGARARALRMLGGSGIEVLSLATNITSLDVDWNDNFGNAVAAALTVHAPQYGVGLIGSSDPYDHLVLPWGSNPVTDHLTSSGLMEIRHDGAGANRTEKVRSLVPWRDATENLRVCYEADRRDRNCGRCEKCIRTMLNFRAIGEPVPPCFDRVATDREIRALTLPAEGGLVVEWEPILSTAGAEGITDSWVSAAHSAVRRAKMRARIAAIPGSKRAHRVVAGMVRRS